ncbi:MAG: hypothetical protein AAF555_10915 [Verrucomicrobiota bacterium]
MTRALLLLASSALVLFAGCQSTQLAESESDTSQPNQSRAFDASNSLFGDFDAMRDKYAGGFDYVQNEDGQTIIVTERSTPFADKMFSAGTFQTGSYATSDFATGSFSGANRKFSGGSFYDSGKRFEGAANQWEKARSPLTGERATFSQRMYDSGVPDVDPNLFSQGDLEFADNGLPAPASMNEAVRNSDPPMAETQNSYGGSSMNLGDIRRFLGKD